MDKPSKLVLSTETLRTLDEQDLAQVTGGQSGICVDTVVCHSGVCGSVVCQSVVCHSGALCFSVIC